MSVSASVRMALSKANKRQLSLGELWNTSPQVISNKLRLERWSGEELVQVAAFTGGKLAFVYPDGQEILISAEEKTKKKEKAKEKKPVKKKEPVKRKSPVAKPEKPKTAGQKAVSKPAKKEPAPKKAQAKKEKPVMKEEQLSMFDI